MFINNLPRKIDYLALVYQRYWLLVIAIGLLGSLALYLFGVPYGVDSPHHYRLAQGFFESINAGDLYPSWLSSTNSAHPPPPPTLHPPPPPSPLPLLPLPPPPPPPPPPSP